MASITENRLKNGRKSYTVFYRDQQGRSREKTFRKMARAREFKSKVEYERDRGVLVDTKGGRRPYVDLANEFMVSARMEWSDSTRLRNDSLMSNHLLPRFGHRPIASLSPADVQQMIAELSLTLNSDTVRKIYHLFRSSLEMAIDQSGLATSPCRGIRLPKQEHREMRFLRIKEVWDLASAIDPRYEAFVLLGAWTGLRPGELRALRIERLNLLHGHLAVEETLGDVGGKPTFSRPKTVRSRRKVELGRNAVETMERHIKNYPPGADGLVFTSPGGLPIHAGNFRRRFWVPAVERSLSGACCVNDLRHTHAAQLIDLGEDSIVIRDRLGHASIMTTIDHYGHLFPGRDREAADKLDAAYMEAGVGVLLG